MLYEHHFRAMNTDVGAWVWSTDPARAPIVCSSFGSVQGLFGQVETELSRFRDTSALSRLNRAAGSGPQPVSPLLSTVLKSALDAAHDSDGIYDPTLLRIMERVGYDRSFETVERTGPANMDSAPAFGSWHRVRHDSGAHTVSLPADLAVDLGGIAKGWTVDRAALALAVLGPALVDAGGDLRVVSAVDGEPWLIGLQDPFEPSRDRGVVRLRDGALATSSVSGRQWQRGDRTLHHVIDPRTGSSADSDLYSVTVHAPSAMTADVAAKVALVLGRRSGTDYLLARGLSAWLIGTDGRDTVVGIFPSHEVDCHASLQCA